MPAYYFDTSALAKRYVVEVGSAWVQAIVTEQSGQTIYTSVLTKSAEKPRHSCRGGIGVGRAGLNAQEPNKTHAVPEPSMGEGTAEREAPAFMPGRTSHDRHKTHAVPEHSMGE